jgi:hypothetical protein
MIFCHCGGRSVLGPPMSHNSTRAVPGGELRNRKTIRSTSAQNDNNDNNAKPPPVADPDDWTWAEFRYLALRALAVIVLFSVLHSMVQKVLLDPFAGIEPPFTDADAQRVARQFKNR